MDDEDNDDSRVQAAADRLVEAVAEGYAEGIPRAAASAVIAAARELQDEVSKVQARSKSNTTAKRAKARTATLPDAVFEIDAADVERLRQLLGKLTPEVEPSQTGGERKTKRFYDLGVFGRGKAVEAMLVEYIKNAIAFLEAHANEDHRLEKDETLKRGRDVYFALKLRWSGRQGQRAGGSRAEHVHALMPSAGRIPGGMTEKQMYTLVKRVGKTFSTVLVLLTLFECKRAMAIAALAGGAAGGGAAATTTGAAAASGAAPATAATSTGAIKVAALLAVVALIAYWLWPPSCDGPDRDAVGDAGVRGVVDLRSEMGGALRASSSLAPQAEPTNDAGSPGQRATSDLEWIRFSPFRGGTTADLAGKTIGHGDFSATAFCKAGERADPVGPGVGPGVECNIGSDGCQPWGQLEVRGVKRPVFGDYISGCVEVPVKLATRGRVTFDCACPRDVSENHPTSHPQAVLDCTMEITGGTVFVGWEPNDSPDFRAYLVDTENRRHSLAAFKDFVSLDREAYDDDGDVDRLTHTGALYLWRPFDPGMHPLGDVHYLTVRQHENDRPRSPSSVGGQVGIGIAVAWATGAAWIMTPGDCSAGLDGSGRTRRVPVATPMGPPVAKVVGPGGSGRLPPA